MRWATAKSLTAGISACNRADSWAKKKIEYAPTDARLGLPRGEYSYVLEDWSQRLCVKEPFAEGVDGLSSILGVAPSVETASKWSMVPPAGGAS